MRKFFTIILVFLLNLPFIWANGLNISSQALTGQVNGSHTFVQFDISWDNSWNTTISTNEKAAVNVHDAVWVFVKYRVAEADGGDGVWRHAKLNTSGHIAPGDPNGASIVADDDKGVFIRRSASYTGTGNVSFTGIKLRWDYTQNIETATISPNPPNYIDDGDNVEVKVFGIEMAHVPLGAFYAGDGDGTTYSDTSFRNSVLEKVLITDISEDLTQTQQIFTDVGRLSTNPVKVDGANGIDTNGDNLIDKPNYPTGYRAFYIMKYEMSQQQYVDFLNTLIYSQQDEYTRTVAPPTSAVGTLVLGTSVRVTVKIAQSSNGVDPAVYETDNPAIACGYVKWDYAKAFADWAALRPMSELEYEKACKGSNNYAPKVYPWGTVDIYGSQYTINSTGDGEYLSEKASGTTSGNALYAQTKPFDYLYRVGIVAYTPLLSPVPNDREDAGASFYGAMEMSGNVWEQVVSLATSTGQFFNGALGDGDLLSSPNWPTTSAVRGGSISETKKHLMVANRFYADKPPGNTGWNAGEGTFGFRAVR